MPRRALAPCMPFPRYARPLPSPPAFEPTWNHVRGPGKTAASCPACRVFRTSRVAFGCRGCLGQPEARPPSLPKGRIPCGIHASRPNPNPCLGARICRRRSSRPGVAGLSGSPTTVATQTSCCTFSRTFARIRSSRSWRPRIAPSARAATPFGGGSCQWMALQLLASHEALCGLIEATRLFPRFRLPRPRVSKRSLTLNKNRKVQPGFLLIKLRVNHNLRTIVPQTYPQPPLCKCGKSLRSACFFAFGRPSSVRLTAWRSRSTSIPHDAGAKPKRGQAHNGG